MKNRTVPVLAMAGLFVCGMVFPRLHAAPPTATDPRPSTTNDAERAIGAYLNRPYSCTVSRVAVDATNIEVTVNAAGLRGALFLADIPAWSDVATLRTFDLATEIPTGAATITMKLDRVVTVNGVSRDRLLSRWAIVRRTPTGMELLSSARYADDVAARWQLPDEQPRSKKGLGGFSLGRAPVSDLDELGIASVTVNIVLGHFMRGTASSSTMAFTSSGKTYYADRAAVKQIDEILRAASDRGIIVLAIILVNRPDTWPDNLGAIFGHPDYDPAGRYSMPNVTTAEGVTWYAAALDFLAERYSRPDKQFGRIHHWIMHNEVDAGWEWTNCGHKPAACYLDQYHKSMRIAHLIARQYTPHARAFISLAHFWNQAADEYGYPGRLLLEYLLAFSRAEGDFDWGIAYHPYPQSLVRPTTWLDRDCDASFDTPLVTFKNIEVLDAWVHQTGTFFRGTHVRQIHLSEQGPNSPEYTETAFAQQAACMAYVWKKIENLDAIKGFQYHNWVDNANEFGLRIGLRKLQNAEYKGDPKPIWHLYRQLGTTNEDAACAFALPIIGITNWNSITLTQPIVPLAESQPRIDANGR